MIQTRYGLPLFVAVAFHAALLLWIPRTNIGSITPPEPPVTLRPFPNELIEIFRPPQEATGQVNDKPKPQAAVPSIDEIVTDQDVHAEFLIPAVERVPAHFVSMDKVPTMIGPGDINGVPDGSGVHGGDGPVSFDRLDRTPHAKVQPSPQYPVAMRASGTEGRVVIEFTVDTAGNVVSATVHSATNREFEEAAVRAVMRWRFEPGRRNGRAVPFRMAVPLEFRLNNNS